MCSGSRLVDARAGLIACSWQACQQAMSPPADDFTHSSQQTYRGWMSPGPSCQRQKQTRPMWAEKKSRGRVREDSAPELIVVWKVGSRLTPGTFQVGVPATCGGAPIPALWHQCPLCLGPANLLPQPGAHARILTARPLARCKAAIFSFPSKEQSFLPLRLIRVEISPSVGGGTAWAAPNNAQRPNRRCSSYPL